MNTNVIDFVVETIKKFHNKSEIEMNKNTKLDSLAIDSISFIRIIVEIEETLNIQFDDDFLMIEQYKTIGDLEEYLARKIDEA
ncbi:acyl carrier protein [Paenibacillus aquistagni]|uniref:acyl carrier protein n=1 Tax=Paenibacillus aquistagni TaxID=1852522 RepID=UPI000B5124EF|nr:acyl carrier protein [Paenibacillus aquistagni]NMM55490.1 acyl carrier protein [Paenibacillus aquistagni]